MDQGSGAGPHRARGCLGAPSCGARAPGAPWARFSAWLECVCVVTFDLELGQALELVYPSDFQLTDKEVGPSPLRSRPHPGSRPSLAFLCFRKAASATCPFPTPTQAASGILSSASAFVSVEGRGAPGTRMTGTVTVGPPCLCRQVKDSSVKRGYFQKSLVLVSRLPFVRLFQALLSLVAPEYFDKLAPCLEAVCNEIDQWPAPVPGQTLNLPVMGVVLQVHIPSSADKPESGPPKQCSHKNLLPAPVVLTSVHELDLFRCFRPVLAHVQLLWELMLLGEPLLVLAPSPAVSSEMVLALTSCLQPLKFCCDYRPYFTVHDSEFKEFTTRTQAPPSVVLGVTNPFFIKTLQHWPHVLRIGEPKMPGDLPKQIKLKKPSRLKTLDTKPGLYTAYTTYLHRDKALLRRLLKGLQRKRPSDVQTAVLRQHLLELTQSFIIPLEHYMASLMPLQKSITPWKTPPQIHPFRQDDFLRSLERSGPQLTCLLKGDWLGLYRRFFKSPHFDGWYRQRHKEMAQKLEALHLEAICEANLEIWMQDKSEVEVVDLVLKLRERLVRAQGHQLPVKEATLKRARLYIETVVGSLPKDLQVVLCPP
ncbi:protein DENND6B isoform X8 [Orcinus orca]|uniref:protein DENND6B isoform X8 n=2 Tax=Delphinidae TaxID=9726 RepID=UPI00122EF943|nr:protein DENND6B isoform X4 [Globicephala melas]XP_033261255.1 protein DENND6B isoform X8 [Orcinus orca]XP_060021046.1 protein DENND6B isoform X1 [Lagenorhynchus albirostris]